VIFDPGSGCGVEVSNREQGETTMTCSAARRTRLGIVLAAALGVLALLALPGLAAAKDGNGDHIPDRWEKRHDLSLGVDQARRDQDHDQMRNRAEFLAGDNPRDRDSDDDGVIDGEENAGTIVSFDAATGRLVIDLFGTDSVGGLVTDGTRIKCEDEHSPDLTDLHGREAEPGDDNGGDNSGPGSGDEATDNSGPGSESSGPSGHDDEGVDANCTTADLVVGAVVEEAELEIEHGAATFDEVELAHSN
jgi:hypothetical protein